jgi:hypothetical protein
MRALTLTVQAVLFLGVAYALAVFARGLLEDWDDWVFAAVMVVGVFGVALMIYQAEYPPRTLKRRFGRSSGPDAPTPRPANARRRRR